MKLTLPSLFLSFGFPLILLAMEFGNVNPHRPASEIAYEGGPTGSQDSEDRMNSNDGTDYEPHRREFLAVSLEDISIDLESGNNASLTAEVCDLDSCQFAIDEAAKNETSFNVLAVDPQVQY